MFFENYSYLPILAMKPAEMAALEELYKSEKDIILPLILMKRWVGSKTIQKSMERAKKAFGDRYWVADIDPSFLAYAEKKITLDNVTQVFQQFIELADPKNGYSNWVNFIKENKNIIPCLQLQKIDQLKPQIDSFLALNRPIVVRLRMTGVEPISPNDFNNIISILIEKKANDVLLILDYGDLTRENLLESDKYLKLISNVNNLLPNAVIAISGTSFPYSFGSAHKGEIPIYERQIFNRIENKSKNIKLIYSDRGSARESNFDGGNGAPPPRIDYALKNDWRFIRKGLDEDKLIERDILYKDAAVEIINSDYWIDGLPAWGRQMIEKTSLGDTFGITSPQKATAVRINLHLHQQIHYLKESFEVDIEEDWED